MSLWKWNDVELEVDFEDADFQEKYEKAFDKLEGIEKELQKTGKLSEITKKYCEMFWMLYDDIFGEGTAEALFHGKKNSRVCEECYDSFIAFCTEQVKEINKKRNSRFAKYKVKK
ncbi:DUF6673 family protein [Blautia argi]|uniref:DUF6673 family protein n=1 Tax=Blautia argi TaxID=1912897 RepID=UPI0026732B50|nr:DUF6673 family protein [Blautia argi]